MDERERQELVEALTEVKELVEQSFPLESSVVRDQILGMLAVAVIQTKVLWRPFGYGPTTDTSQRPAGARPMTEEERQAIFGGECPRLDDFLKQTSLMLGAQIKFHTEDVAAMLTKVAVEKGTEWTWETFVYFVGKLMEDSPKPKLPEEGKTGDK